VLRRKTAIHRRATAGTGARTASATPTASGCARHARCRARSSRRAARSQSRQSARGPLSAPRREVAEMQPRGSREAAEMQPRRVETLSLPSLARITRRETSVRTASGERWPGSAAPAGRRRRRGRPRARHAGLPPTWSRNAPSPATSSTPPRSRVLRSAPPAPPFGYSQSVLSLLAKVALSLGSQPVSLSSSQHCHPAQPPRTGPAAGAPLSARGRAAALRAPPPPLPLPLRDWAGQRRAASMCEAQFISELLSTCS